MKRYITAMARTRKQCLERFENVSKELHIHVMKCIIYKNVTPDALDHWCQEIGAWLHYVNNMQCKVALKEEDYVSTVFIEFDEEVSDAELDLALYRAQNKRLLQKHSDDAYPDFDVTTELASDLAEFCNKIIDFALPILLSNNVLTSSEWAQSIRKFIGN